MTSFFGQNFGWMTDHISSLGAFILYDGLLPDRPDDPARGLLLEAAEPSGW